MVKVIQKEVRGPAVSGSGIGQMGGEHSINPMNLKKESDFFKGYITHTAQQIGDEAVQDIEEVLFKRGFFKRSNSNI